MTNNEDAYIVDMLDNIAKTINSGDHDMNIIEIPSMDIQEGIVGDIKVKLSSENNMLDNLFLPSGVIEIIGKNNKVVSRTLYDCKGDEIMLLLSFVAANGEYFYVRGLYPKKTSEISIEIPSKFNMYIDTMAEKHSLHSEKTMAREIFIMNLLYETLAYLAIANYASYEKIGSVREKRIAKKQTNKSSNSKKSKNKKSKKNKSKVKLIKKYYIDLTKFTEDDRENIVRKSFTRHTESWDVAGHWRTYKSGKKVWIDSYVKGQGNKNSKVYKLNLDN